MPPVTLPKPTITPEGQAAANRIAEARQNVNNGATPAQARQLNRTLQAGPATPQRANTTIRAADIGNAPAQTTPPQPTPATIPNRVGQMVGNVTRDTQGFIVNQSAEAAKARELADTFGALNNEGSLADMMRAERSNLGIDTNLKELQDIQLQLTDIDTGSGLTKTRIEGAAGQTVGQSQREVTQEDRENAVRTSGLAARAAVLQGNINTATQLARDTVDLAFKDRQLKAENLLNQLNYFQGISDDQTGQLLEQDKRQYEEELANIKDLKDNIANAMVNGASQAEITQLNDANLDDASKLALAQSITARGAGEMRGLEIEQSRASINASNASAANSVTSRLLSLAEKGDSNAIAKLGFDPRSTTGNFEAESSLRKEFFGLKPVQAAEGVQQSFSQINAAYAQALKATTDGTSKAAADQALIISYNKMLDPGSVVREGEFARSTQGQSLINQAQAKIDQLAKGGAGLTDSERKSIVDVTRVLYSDYIDTYNKKALDYRQNAIRQGGDPNFVAGFMDTIGKTAESAQEGDVIIKNGVPFMKQGNEMVQLDI